MPSAKDCISFVDKGSQATVIAFAGLAGMIGLPDYEWKKITTDLEMNIILVRDPTQSWYQVFLTNGIGQGLQSMLREVGALALLERSGGKFAIGNSMGAFAALSYGPSLGVDKVLAFSPQTFIDPMRRLLHRDRRWAEQISRIHSVYGFFNKSYDVQQVLRRRASRHESLPQIKVFVGSNSRLDAVHGKRLSNLDCVDITSVSGAGHDAVKILKERGVLLGLLRDEMA